MGEREQLTNEPREKIRAAETMAILEDIYLPHRPKRHTKEGFLSLRVATPEENTLTYLSPLFVKGNGAASQQVRMAVHDCYKRLLSISIETGMHLDTKKRADEEAIKVFSENLRQLLPAPPLGQKNVLAVDPEFRTGCKVICLERQGKLLHTDIIYPHYSETGASESCCKGYKSLQKIRDRGHCNRKRYCRKGNRAVHKKA